MVNKIDDILKRRHAPQPPSNMAERIIEASKHQSAAAGQGRFSLRAWMETFFDGFLMPHPAFAMMVLLLAGVVFGTYTGAQIEDQSVITQEELFSALYSESDFNAGEWL